ncbi:MAG: NADH-quinone oxidoreductase subunit L [Gemmataceae bacterium]|nr:NADH-quinone oxidoreductase subunit L [Gemmataceae bacterium]
MFDVCSYLWLIPALPLLGCIATAALGPRWLRGQSHWPCILGAVGACVLSVLTLIAVPQGAVNADGAPVPYLCSYYEWFRAGDVDVSFALRADGLTAVMLVTVTFIGSLIVIYSVGYMHGDPGYPRYFAVVSLFLFSMTGLVLANNFIVLYAFWEGVGLCSYLLIGYWFSRPSAAAAARKAFLVTRLGDIGLFLGILVLWTETNSLDFDVVLGQAHTLSAEILTIACLLLFAGAVGKSAQFPLHVWLPDAMEGPSPVSALIHAATMVTAGVYLVARCMPLFGQAPDAQLVVAVIGGFTALLAALIALTQTDLKRVLAYSTISQLGYMFLALGSGVEHHRLAALAATAAIFHLVTHAFFKALLFLGAGSVMHAMGDVIDMRRFGGLRKLLPVTHWTFLCGAAALAGFPVIFSGFWSKDEILAVTWEASRGGPHAVIYFVLLVTALGTAGLTAFYTFRAYFMTFWGEQRLPEEAGHHPHDAAPVMGVPLMILAAGAVLAGIVLGPTGLFGGFLEHYWSRSELPTRLQAAEAGGHALNVPLMLISAAVALGGIGLAYVLYVRTPALVGTAARMLGGLYGWSRNKFYLDELFEALFVRPFAGLARLCKTLDQYLVDGLVDLIGQVPAFVGYVMRPFQNGLVQFYALLMALGVAGFLLATMLR